MLTPSSIAIGFGALMCVFAVFSNNCPRHLATRLKNLSPFCLARARIVDHLCAVVCLVNSNYAYGYLGRVQKVYARIYPRGCLADLQTPQRTFSASGAGWATYFCCRSATGWLARLGLSLAIGEYRDGIPIMVIKGMMLVLFPYMFRKSVEFWGARPVMWKTMPLVALIYAGVQFFAAYKCL